MKSSGPVSALTCYRSTRFGVWRWLAATAALAATLLFANEALANCYGPRIRASRFVRDLIDFGNMVPFIVGLLVVALVGALRKSSRATGWLLLGITVVALIVRLLQSDSVPMTAWPYSRMVPLAERLACATGFRELVELYGWGVFETNLSHHVNLIMSVLTPAVVFAHARALLDDERQALAAAAILALLPMHIRFSASDIHFIQSMMMSSLSFALLYDQLKTRRALRVWGLGLAIAFATIAMYQARPLNVLFAPLFAFAILVTSGPSVPRRRRLLTLAMIVATSLFFFIAILLPNFHAQVSEGLSFSVLYKALKGLIDTSYNTLINPSVTPLGLTLLAILGGVSLRREGRSAVLVFLVGWLAAFYVAHSIIQPRAIENAARYHMHIVVPFVLLAAASLPWILRQPRWCVALIGIYIAASPILHQSFIRAGDYTMEQEYLFIDELRDIVAEGCTFAEYNGYSDNRHRESKDLSEVRRKVGRIQRMAKRVADEPLWNVVDITTSRSGISEEGVSTYTLAGEGISPVAQAALDAGPECAVYFQGYHCHASQTPEHAMAPECLRMHELYELTPIKTVTVPMSVYDRNEAPYCMDDGFCRPDVDLTLYRVNRRER